YDNSLPYTWKWLNDHQDGKPEDKVLWIDFGVSSIHTKWKDETTPETRKEVTAPAPDAPVLFPAHLDCWVQTNPIPTPDPAPARPGQPDVQVVFRADVRSDWSDADVQRLWAAFRPDASRREREKPTEDKRFDLWLAAVAACPPSSSEAVPVRISDFRRWLAGL